MFLKHLGLRNFRSYKNLNIDINSNLNFIYGANGTGKTGLLEAIRFLSETRSFKKCDDKELINIIGKEKAASLNEILNIDGSNIEILYKLDKLNIENEDFILGLQEL